MAVCSFPLALDCAERAATCAAIRFRHKHGRGVVSLKAIAYLAPLLGAFGTTKALIEGLVQPPCAECAGGLSESFVLLLLSFPVAILAYCTFHFLKRQIEALDLEMKTGALDLLNNLARTR